MRALRLPFLLAALLAWVSDPGYGATKHPTKPEVEFVRVWPQWHQAYEFKRISEYFTGRENTGTWRVRRSQPINRTGYYFLARVRHPRTSLEGARFVLHIITPDSPDPRTFTYPAGVGPGEHVFELGITGSDWAGERVHPVAWRLDLLAPDGHELAWYQSFMWEMPGPHLP
jgi:hypothetical protein